MPLTSSVMSLQGAGLFQGTNVIRTGEQVEARYLLIDNQ